MNGRMVNCLSPRYSIEVLRPFLLLIAFVAFSGAQERKVTPTSLTGGLPSARSFDGFVEIFASGSLGVGPNYFGVEGGTNRLAVDDADGLTPADEWLDWTFQPEVGLSSFEVRWTRGRLSLTGFAADPEALQGSYDEESQTWSLNQNWTGGNTVRYQFSNLTASKGRTLRLTISDSSFAAPQVAVVALTYQGSDLPPPMVSLVANPAVRGQRWQNFGASMLWTIDPTEGWPVEVKEELALKLMSKAGGIGLSGLRFDFGGGDIGTGNRTAEPWTWRFPEALKDSATGPFDWTRREGQQWFLRRSQELAVADLTLAAISPPWWMTKSGRSYPDSQSGSTNLAPDKREDFAVYLSDVVEHFKVNEGITFDLVSPINEPEWDWEGGGQEGNRGTAEDIRGMVGALHAEFVERGLASETKIEVGDHAVINSLLDDATHTTHLGGPWNGGNNRFGKYREYFRDLMSHPDIVGKVSPVASYHSYFNDSPGVLQGNLRQLLANDAATHSVDVAQTEYAILGSYGPIRDLQIEPAQHVFRTLHKDLTQAGVVAWSWWLALSPHDFKDGLIYTDFASVSDTDPQLFDSKIFWMLGHYSRFLRPGWQRIGSGGLEDVGRQLSSAWLSPDGREVVLVVGNLQAEAVQAQLPESLAGVTGRIREWQPWTTDRGRSLRRGDAVSGTFLLAPNSITTLVARVSESPFRLRTVIETPSWSVAKGESVTFTARATWEDGSYRIPALHLEDHWIFERMSGESDGVLQDGRYWIRRETDGAYLGVSSGSGERVSTLLEVSPNEGWEVAIMADDRLELTEIASGRTLGEEGLASRLVRDSVLAERQSLSAEFLWSDGLGEGSQASFDALVPRWIEVESRVGDELARARAKLRVESPQPILSGLAEEVFVRLGESRSLRVIVEDLGQPWRFRMLPPDRDEVLVYKTSLQMALPKGQLSEQWELVEVGGSRVWTMAERERPCWIRHVASGGYLQPSDFANSGDDSLTLAPAAGTNAEWLVEQSGASYRLRHPASGLALGWPAGAQEPTLVPDSGQQGSSVYLDALVDEPMEVDWSHGLGSGLRQVVSPAQTTRYTAHAKRAGVSQSQSTLVVVQRTFSEWSLQWFGEVVSAEADHDSDGIGALLEYAAGTNPLDATDFISARLVLEDSAFEVAWQKNVEALGTWKAEWSPDLVSWNEVPLAGIEEDPRNFAVTVSQELPAKFVRLRFATNDLVE